MKKVIYKGHGVFIDRDGTHHKPPKEGVFLLELPDDYPVKGRPEFEPFSLEEPDATSPDPGRVKGRSVKPKEI